MPLNMTDYGALENLLNDASQCQLEKKEEITMTRKDFAEIASILKSLEFIPQDHRVTMALAFIHYFQSKNPNFNECTFMAACGFKAT